MNDDGEKPTSGLLDLLPKPNSASSFVKRCRDVNEICKCLELDDAQLRNIMSQMQASFQQGLNPATAKDAPVKMLNTCIDAVSKLEEKGEFLVLELDIIQLRVSLIELKGGSESSTVKEKTFHLPEKIQGGKGTALFNHMAKCLDEFIGENQLRERNLALGFIFPFPCNQQKLTSAVLTNWTKAFDVSDVEGKDVAQMLREACLSREVRLGVIAVLNDTTSTMLACSFVAQHCYMGVVVDSGCNACYMERDGRSAEMCVNTEWGGFGDDGKLNDFLTQFDRKTDERTSNKGRHRFEKTMSAIYLGGIVQTVLEELTSQGVLFGGDMEQIKKVDYSPTKHMWLIESQMRSADSKSALNQIENLLQRIGYQNPTPADCVDIAYVCRLVSTRAAHLCACGIAALLERMQRPFVMVGVEGAMFRSYPTFMEMVRDKVEALVGDKHKFLIVLCEEGKALGAAIAAEMAASRLADENARTQLGVDLNVSTGKHKNKDKKKTKARKDQNKGLPPSFPPVFPSAKSSPEDVTHISQTIKRGRIESTVIFDVIQERIEYLERSKHPEEAQILKSIVYDIRKFIREKVPEQETFTTEQRMRSKWSSRIDAFIANLSEKEGKTMNGLARESVVVIFMSIAHSAQITALNNAHSAQITALNNAHSAQITELQTTNADLQTTNADLQTTNADLQKKLYEAMSVYTPRQALEEIAGEPKDQKKIRAHKFARMLMNNEKGLQRIVNEAFIGYKWDGRTIDEKTQLSFKSNMCYELYNECYECASENEVHYRPGSAPPMYGIIVNRNNYNGIQRKFMEVVASCLQRAIQFV